MEDARLFSEPLDNMKMKFIFSYVPKLLCVLTESVCLDTMCIWYPQR